MKYHFIIPLFTLLLLSSCIKQEDMQAGGSNSIAIPGSSNRPGLGSTAGNPTGRSFTLPGGISMVERRHHAFDPDPGKLFGNMNTFYADVSLVNETGNTITVLFPAGLILQAYANVQNGLLMEDVSIAIPPGTEDTTTFYLGLACLNQHKALPWEDNFDDDVKNYPIGKGLYTPTVTTDDEHLIRLLDIVKKKPKLRVSQHYNPQEQYLPGYVRPAWQEIYDELQARLWDITDGNGIKQEDLDALNKALKPYE